MFLIYSISFLLTVNELIILKIFFLIQALSSKRSQILIGPSWIQTVMTLMVVLKEIFENDDFEKNKTTADNKKSMQDYPACKEFNS